jgi:hypothetical protein
MRDLTHALARPLDAAAEPETLPFLPSQSAARNTRGIVGSRNCRDVFGSLGKARHEPKPRLRTGLECAFKSPLFDAAPARGVCAARHSGPKLRAVIRAFSRAAEIAEDLARISRS